MRRSYRAIASHAPFSILLVVGAAPAAHDAGAGRADETVAAAAGYYEAILG